MNSVGERISVAAMPLQRAVQEAEYVFPYHYLDLESDRHRLIDFVPTMSRYRLVADRLGDVRGLSVLDAGCGDGRFCYDWRHSGAKLVGVDYCERAIAFARAFTPSCEFHCCDVSDLAIDQSFDRIVLIETLEHVPPEEVPGFLAKLARVLKPGGRFVVTVPSKRRPLGRKHYQHFDEACLRACLTESFEVLGISGYGVMPDWRARVRKRFAKMAYPSRRGSGWWPEMVRGYGDWYHQRYGEGSPSKCRGLIAVVSK